MPASSPGHQASAPVARGGVDVRAEHLTRYRGLGRKRRKTNDDISLHVRPGEFVAIIGGSGSGKSTLLNELNGREPADEGSVLVDGVDLYANFERLRGAIGFVPQQDIIHDDLTLADTLRYAARMRMPYDTPSEVREQRIQYVLECMHLEDERENRVGSLSGGQKKRASIAVELLSDPRLLYLDEPTSGLDPSLERDLMHRLSAMAKEGRTVVLVTHTPANLDLCDKLAVLGKGGRLCYFGSPRGALEFFGKTDLVDVYDEVSSEQGAEAWRQHFGQVAEGQGSDFGAPAAQAAAVPEGSIERPAVGQQLRTLVSRYARLVINDHSRLVILLGQAPLLAFLIAFVAGDGCFQIYEQTKSCLFALSCAAFWVGILDSIQEICKERPIFERECDSGIRISSYVLSKLVVLGAICVLQSALLTVTFCLSMGAFEGVSWQGMATVPVQLFATSVFIMLSAMCLGLLVSAIFSNPDRAIACAPLLIMPQILFAGVVVELEGVIETISYFITCRWGMSGYGTTAALTVLNKSIVGKTINGTEVKGSWDLSALSPAADVAMYGQGIFGLISAWSVMLVSCALFVGLCLLVLRISTRKRA